MALAFMGLMGSSVFFPLFFQVVMGVSPAHSGFLTGPLSRDLRLFVAAQPTRGLDVGSIEFVHKRIVATRDAGVPVIVVSTELDEVAALADRIAVMYRGGIVGIVPGDTSRDVLGLMMAGESPEQAGAAV